MDRTEALEVLRAWRNLISPSAPRLAIALDLAVAVLRDPIVVEVGGGVAGESDQFPWPDGVEVIIRDWDNIKSGDDDPMEGYTQRKGA